LKISQLILNRPKQKYGSDTVWIWFWADGMDRISGILMAVDCALKVARGFTRRMKIISANGGVRISAGQTGSMVAVTVADSGIGIPRERRNSIFQAFEQVDSGDARSSGGTGLGLSITRQLVELHGGTIAVNSEPGRVVSLIMFLSRLHVSGYSTQLPDT
jgi:hypothetical protein